MLQNKLAIITGASRGVGKAAAINFAKLGFDVALLAKNKDLLQTTAKEIKAKYQVNAGVFSIDISNQKEVKNCINYILEHHHSIDILFNNAGILAPGLLDITEENIINQIETNILGTYYMLKAIAPKMKQQQSGYIFNMSSRSGKVAIPQFGAYSATKFAILGINEALYEEMMPYNVKVTALCPSVIHTDMSKDFNIPHEEKIQVDDIINTINYLLTLSPGALVKEIDIECKYVILNPHESAILPPTN